MPTRCKLLFLLLIVCGSYARAASSANSGNLAHCHFRQAGDHYVGSCGPLFDQNPVMTLKPVSSVTTGVWREDLRPSSVWAGDMTDQGYPNAQLELEIYEGGSGILRTEYGWYRVMQFRSSPENGFLLDAAEEVQPNVLDKKIILRAAAILSTEQVWNRADNRSCPQDATSWSIYCAMEKATTEVTGGFQHRRPALELIRDIVHERTAARHYHHWVKDYNNDPTTTLADVHSLFREALARIRDQ
jgi:hypothetical protein